MNYTPDEEQVREQYTQEQPPQIGTVAEKSAEFDRFIARIKADAMEALLADDAIERAARRIYRHQVPAHLACVMTQWEEAHERQRDHFRSVARAALEAALGIEGDE